MTTISGSAVSTPVTTPATLDRLVNAYAWLSDVKGDLAVTSTEYDALLVLNIERASRMVDGLVGWRFYPLLATRYFDVDDDDHERVCDGTFYLPSPLLAVTSIETSNDDGATYTALATTDYYLTYGSEYSETPYFEITLSENGSYDYWYEGQRALKVTGVWGYRRQYAAGWENSQDTATVAMNASQTTVTVADANGASQWGVINRFQVGQLLRIDSEYMAVTGVNTTTNVLTVVRACNGTTAAVHSDGTRIDVWRPEPMAANVARIQAVRWFKRAQQAFADVSAAMELGQLTYAQELDPDIRSMLKAGLMRLI